MIRATLTRRTKSLLVSQSRCGHSVVVLGTGKLAVVTACDRASGGHKRQRGGSGHHVRMGGGRCGRHRRLWWSARWLALGALG